MGSRKKHRNRENQFYGNDEGRVNNPLGLDLNTLSSLFGNIDQNQLMSMIQMLGQNGIDMDKVGGVEQGQINGGNNLGNSFNNIGNNSLGSIFNNMGNNDMGNTNMGNTNMGNISGNNIKMDNYGVGNNKNKDYMQDEKEGELDTKTLINKLIGNNPDLNFIEDERLYEEINKKQSIKEEEESIKNDLNIEMLLALRKIVSKERVRFIDKIIQLYIKGEFGEF